MQLAAMVASRSARILIASADLMPLAREIAARAPGSKRVLVIDGECADRRRRRARTVDHRPPIRRRLGRVRRDRAVRPVLHLGHHRRAQGRDLHPSLQLPAHAAGCCRPTSWRSRGTDAVLAVVPMFHANAWGLPFALPGGRRQARAARPSADGASLAG
jgi:hypothetical protein